MTIVHCIILTSHLAVFLYEDLVNRIGKMAKNPKTEQGTLIGWLQRQVFLIIYALL